MRDYRSIGQAQGIPVVEAHLELVEQLAATIVRLRDGMPFDSEPAPVFQPLRGVEPNE